MQSFLNRLKIVGVIVFLLLVSCSTPPKNSKSYTSTKVTASKQLSKPVKPLDPKQLHKNIYKNLQVTPKPKLHNNICQLFNRFPSWYYFSKRSTKRWKVPIPVIMSIIRYESSFRPKARPTKRIKKHNRYVSILASTAYGYSQAKTMTWREYQQHTKQKQARRDNIMYAVDFIGWYNHLSRREIGLSLNDAYNLYLAYHEGRTGYKRRTHTSKRWLLKVARKVSKTSKKYHKQLNSCRRKLDSLIQKRFNEPHKSNKSKRQTNKTITADSSIADSSTSQPSNKLKTTKQPKHITLNNNPPALKVTRSGLKQCEKVLGFWPLCPLF